jgi:type IV secretion system protein VirB9
MIGTDPRVSIRDYAENQVITFAARPNYQSTIQFGDEERIENIAVGESGAWQITPNRRANLLRQTHLGQSARHQHDRGDRPPHLLVRIAQQRGARPLYLLRFAYAPDPSPPRPFPRRKRQA